MIAPTDFKGRMDKLKRITTVMGDHIDFRDDDHIEAMENERFTVR